MTATEDFEGKFWKALESDKMMMLGIDGEEDGHTRPMTAQVDGHRSPIWFFTSRDNVLAQKLKADSRAIATFASKGHDLFAAIQGRLSVETDRGIVDRLWNRSVAAWYPLGKDDPALTLLRFDAQRAEIWRHESSALAGMKLFFGGDPAKERAKDVAEVRLG